MPAGTDPVLAARIAANTRWSRESGAEQNRKMLEGLEQRFLREVDPDGVLDERERARRAKCARKAHYARLSLAGVKARRERAAKRRPAVEPEAADGAA